MGKALTGELINTTGRTGLLVNFSVVNTTILYSVEIINNLEYMHFLMTSLLGIRIDRVFIKHL